MSRNVQVLRQWLLFQKLERARGATLEELVGGLPSDYACHPRTVRRDLEVLETNFPVITDRRDGKTIWRLMDSTFGFRDRC